MKVFSNIRQSDAPFTYLPHSRTTRDAEIVEANTLPRLLRATKTCSAITASRFGKIASKKRLAVSS